MRKNRPLILIDIAVPRDVAPEVGQMEGVFLYNIDDLEDVVDTNKAIRASEAETAEQIIEEEVQGLKERLRYLSMRPVMLRLGDKMDLMRQRVLKHDVCAKLAARTAILVSGLQNAAEKAGLNYQFHLLGSMFTVFFTEKEVTDYATALTSDQDAFKIYFHSMLEQGIYLPPSQFETNFISLAHSDEDFEKTLQAAEIAFGEVAKRK